MNYKNYNRHKCFTCPKKVREEMCTKMEDGKCRKYASIKKLDRELMKKITRAET